MNHFIPLSVPNFEGNERKYVDDAIDQAWVSTGGAYITDLENKIATFLNVDNVAACQSGTSAIHLALRLCGVEPGDMVIVPAITFIAAVNPIRYQFADPVFMDCDDSLCLDPSKLREFCQNECELSDNFLIDKDTGKKIKALVVVHVFGNMADMDSIREVAKDYNLKVIEDATEALGTRYISGKYAGKYAGTIGDFGAFSFNGNKIITTGGGGALTGRNAKDVNTARYLSTQAKDEPHFYIHNEIGYNYRMTNLQAALGVAQMEELPEFIVRKQNNYDFYKNELSGYEKGELLSFREGTDSNKWFYSFVIDRNKTIMTMHDIVDSFARNNIQIRTIWGLINEQLPYQGCITYRIEKAYYFYDRVINLPCSTNLTEDEISYVSKVLKEIIK